MKEVIILVPSYRRAGKVEIIKIYPDCLIVCHDKEYKEYKKYYGNKVVAISDDLIGNMAKVRNEMLKIGYSKTSYVGMIDDDVELIGCYDIKNLKRYKIEYDSRDINELIYYGFDLCEQFSCKLWGINIQCDPKFYSEVTPFGLTVPILGPFSMHIKNKIRYDERLYLNEDYDYYLMHLYKYRKVLRLNKWHYLADHLSKKGGCASYRTYNQEREQAEIMVKKWGDGIVKYNFDKSFNPRIYAPI